MKLSRKILALISCIFLLFTTAGCGSTTPQASTPIALPTASPTISATPRPTSRPTTTHQIPTDVSPAPSDTPYPEPIQITPVPEPINQTGPWLMLHPDIFYTGAARIVAPVFVNADGSGWEPANLPRDPHDPPDDMDWWFGSVSPKGSYAAFQGYLSEYEAECNPEHNFWNFRGMMLHILKLPENRIVREFLLIGDAAGDQIDQYACKNKDAGEAPVLGVIANPSSLSWSPDGRYLAFPAAPDGPSSDLYLYDTTTNEVRRLTTRQNNPDILGWSPDGQTIIYRSITKMRLFKTQFLESGGLYAVSLSGRDRLLFEPEVIPKYLRWLSSSQFLIDDGPCDFWGGGICATNLRLVDLSTGKHEVLYKNPKVRVYYETDPIHHMILVTNPPSDMPGLAGMDIAPYSYLPDISYVQGVFQFDLTTRSLRPVLLGGSGDFVWDSNLAAFRQNTSDMDPPYTRHQTLIRFLPGGDFTVEKMDDPPNISPDGMWSAGKVGEDWYILDAQNQPVQKLLGNGPCGWTSHCWSPDSSIYVQLEPDDRMAVPELIVYQKANNWKPEVIRTIEYGQLWTFDWIVP